MKKITLIVILFSNVVAFAGHISGYVNDMKTGETIIGVNVMLENTEIGAATDETGFFIIRNVPTGSHALNFSHVSYQNRSYSFHSTGKNIFWESIILAPSTIQTEAIEIIGQRSTIIEKDMDISSFEVDPIILFEAPQMSKDVFKLMKFSPSVSISDPLSPQFHVRGSDPGENLVQLDGMTIYNPQHFMASQAIFNPYSIKNIEMLVGGFDAEHGGRNASILNITSREGHQSEVHGEFRPSINGISGAVEFPVNDHATAMISGRYNTDISFRVLMGVPNVMADFNGAFQTKIGKTKLRFSSFYARDYMDYNIKQYVLYLPADIFNSFEEGFITNTENRAVGLRSHSVISPDLLFESQIYYSASDVNNKTYVNISEEDTAYSTEVEIQYDTRIGNGISDITAKANLIYYTFFNQTIKFGTEFNYLTFYNKIGSTFSNRVSTTRSSDLQAFFVQDKIEMGPLLFKFGTRNSRAGTNNNWRIEPRASMALKTILTTVKLSWGKYNQYVSTMNTSGHEFIQTLDYYNSLKNYAPVASEHFVLGIEGYLNEKINYSVSAYYKDLYRLYRSNYAEASSSININGDNIIRGHGEAYGVESLVRGEIGKLSGWISYTWARGTRSYPTIQNGKHFLYDGDQTHNFKAVLLYKLTPKITGSTTFHFSSGYPKTWETAKYSQFHYDPVRDKIGWFPRDLTPVKNNVRFPPRIQWDIGWKKKLRKGFGFYLAEYLGCDEAYFTMTVRNLLFLHRDPYYYFYFPEFGYYGFGMSYFPSVSAGYSIKF